MRGRAFQESDLVRLVRNVTYLGKLRKAEQVFSGKHTAIVDSDLWERANAAVNGVGELCCSGASKAPLNLQHWNAVPEFSRHPPCRGIADCWRWR